MGFDEAVGAILAGDSDQRTEAVDFIAAWRSDVIDAADDLALRWSKVKHEDKDGIGEALALLARRLQGPQ